MDFTPTTRNDMSKKELSSSPTRPMCDGITVGVSSKFDRLMISMGTQKGGASSGTRLQPQLTSSSLGLTPVSGAAGDMSDMFAGVMTGLEELQRDMSKRIGLDEILNGSNREEHSNPRERSRQVK